MRWKPEDGHHQTGEHSLPSRMMLLHCWLECGRHVCPARQPQPQLAICGQGPPPTLGSMLSVKAHLRLLPHRQCLLWMIDVNAVHSFMFTPSCGSLLHQQCAGIPSVPVFRPTPQEWALGPIAYLEKIKPEAEKYGLAHIVPPPG